jgi:hypothetical protein
MTRVRGVSGGGYESNKVAHTNNPKTEPQSHPVSVGAVSRLGAKVGEGTPLKTLYQNYNPQQASTPIGPTHMNVAGPGAGRMVMPSGSQSKTPAPHSMGKSRKF